MTAATTIDTAILDATPAAGKSRDMLSLLTLLVAANNANAALVDLNTSGLTADAAGRAKIAAGFFDAATVDSAFAVNTIGMELLEAEIDGTVLGNTPDIAASPTSSPLSLRGAFSIQHADHATETLIYKTTRKIQITSIEVLKSGNGAGNTVQLKDGAHNVITEAVAADTDKGRTSSATVDPAFSTIAAGATFELVFTRLAGSSLCQVVISALPRA